MTTEQTMPGEGFFKSNFFMGWLRNCSATCMFILKRTSNKDFEKQVVIVLPWMLITSLIILLFPQCLCLSPTYELALQTGKVIEQMGNFYPDLKLAYAVRGNKRE